MMVITEKEWFLFPFFAIFFWAQTERLLFGLRNFLLHLSNRLC